MLDKKEEIELFLIESFDNDEWAFTKGFLLSFTCIHRQKKIEARCVESFVVVDDLYFDGDVTKSAKASYQRQLINNLYSKVKE